MQIGSLSLTCVWQSKDSAKIFLPLNAPPPVILSAALKYSQEEITRSGLAKVVASAEEKRDDLLDRASKILEPLGITWEELSRFVDEQVQGVELSDSEDE